MFRIYTDPRCLEHRPPIGFPERPERVGGIVSHLRERGYEFAADGSTAGKDSLRAAVAAVHDERYVERFRAATERGDGLLDSADNPLSAGTWPAAWAAVEQSLEAVDWAQAGPGRAAFVAVRPPGHHAERSMAMGFCFFNNVAVAAEHLIRRHGLERVAILDFDVHHGNGTQHLFEERGDVFFASLHQSPFYPGTGAAEETGRGAGIGRTLNVPLPAGTADDVYEQAFKERVLPALKAFEPRFLLVSAGFDAWQRDPIGGMRVTADGYERWGSLIRGLADEVTAGRSVSLLEGGYDLEAMPALVDRYLSGLRGT